MANVLSHVNHDRGGMASRMVYDATIHQLEIFGKEEEKPEI